MLSLTVLATTKSLSYMPFCYCHSHLLHLISAIASSILSLPSLQVSCRHHLVCPMHPNVITVIALYASSWSPYTLYCCCPIHFILITLHAPSPLPHSPHLYRLTHTISYAPSRPHRLCCPTSLKPIRLQKIKLVEQRKRKKAILAE
jgi:hypothetical protein